MDLSINFESVTLKELQEEYIKLWKQYSQYRDTNEEKIQHLYELKRNLATSAAAELYLTQELEQMSISCSAHQHYKDLFTKMERQLDDGRRKYNDLLHEYELLQKNLEIARNENGKLREKADNITLMPSYESITGNNKDHSDRADEREKENHELCKKLNNAHEQEIQYTLTIAKYEKTVDVLSEQVRCLEENLQAKYRELEEINSLFGSTQQQLVDANIKLTALCCGSEKINEKGNSLFAEVDDQRQALKELIKNQKESYMQMKKSFNESEYVIRRLKRENVAMQNELQTCCTIFHNAEKTYHETLGERIRKLESQNEVLEKKLSWTYEQLKEVATGNNLVWVDSLLNFCKQETMELKSQLHSAHFQKATLDEQLRSSQQEMAKWRFEALRSKCNMNHENLTKNEVSTGLNRTLRTSIKYDLEKTLTPEVELSDDKYDSGCLIKVRQRELQTSYDITSKKEHDSLHAYVWKEDSIASANCDEEMHRNADVMCENVRNKQNITEYVNLCGHSESKFVKSDKSLNAYSSEPSKLNAQNMFHNCTNMIQDDICEAEIKVGQRKLQTPHNITSEKEQDLPHTYVRKEDSKASVNCDEEMHKNGTKNAVHFNAIGSTHSEILDKNKTGNYTNANVIVRHVVLKKKKDI